MNTYNDAINLLTSREKFHIKLGLERVQALLEYFGNPQDRIKCIHVAGTNGKGSTCAMLASVLAAAGYKTGLYTSPHLMEYTERMKINGQNIPEQQFARLVFEVVNYSKKADIPATEFEILTVAAFSYFYEQKVDFALIETGLGGRLDATNFIKKPELSIITSIDLDHTARLGETIEQIAFEKAGIIKQNTPVITLEDNNGLEVIKKKALEASSPLILANYSKINEQGLNLNGLWMKKNLCLVLKAVDALRNKRFAISDEAEEKGIKNFSWPARFQYIKDENLIIDAAHNPSAAIAFRQSLDYYFPDFQRIFVYSSLKTKDFRQITDHLFRKEDIVILTRLDSPSSENPEVIKEYIEKTKGCDKIYSTQNVKEAMDLYKKLGNKENLIIFTGSIYTIGEFFALRKQEIC